MTGGRDSAGARGTAADSAAALPFPADGAAGVFSRETLAMPHLEALLGVERVAAFPRRPDGLAFVLGWGDKPSAAVPRRFGARHGVPFVAAEDGFLRSVGNHRIKPPPLSLVLDDLGIYYRAAEPSRLERLILAAPTAPAAMRAEGERARARVVAEKLTKYNTIGDPGAATPAGGGRPIGILLVDQVFGDQSVRGGLASAETFEAMVAAALAERPAAEIAVKVHPDVLAGRARGYLLDAARRHGLALEADTGNPFDLLARVERVFTVSSQLGFEALLAGRRVTCFGVPFYAGWGLTEDRAGAAGGRALARRGVARSLADLFTAAYVAYPRYADPVTRAPIGVLAAIDRVLEWRAALAPRPRAVQLRDWPFGERLAEAAFAGGGAAPVECGWRRASFRDDRVAAAWGFDGVVAAEAEDAGPACDAERRAARALLAALAVAPFARVRLVRDAALEAAQPRVPSGAAGRTMPAATASAPRRETAVILAAEPEPDDAAVVAAASASGPVAVYRLAPRPRGPSPLAEWARVVLARRGTVSVPVAAPPRFAAVHLAPAVADLALDALAAGIPATVHGPAGPDRIDPEALEDLAIEDLVITAQRRFRAVDPASGLPAGLCDIVALGNRVAAGVERRGPDPERIARAGGWEKRVLAALRSFAP